MRHLLKLALVPLVVLWLWALPKDQPDDAFVGASVATVATVNIPDAEEPLADASDDSAAIPSSVPATVSVDVLASNSTVPLTTALQAATDESEGVSSTVAPTVAPATEQQPTPTTNAPSVPIEQVALGLVSFDWQTVFPTWRVDWSGPRTGIRALTYPSERRIEIFIRADDTAESLHRVLAHELGHVIDVSLNDDADRARWAEQRNIPAGTPWWPSAAAPDFATGAGDFAEAFAVMETGVTSQSSVGNQPTSADLDLLRELMRG